MKYAFGVKLYQHDCTSVIRIADLLKLYEIGEQLSEFFKQDVSIVNSFFILSFTRKQQAVMSYILIHNVYYT